MKSGNFKLDVKGEKAILIPFGDLHYGSKYCNVKSIQEWLSWIADSKDTFVFLMGDLMESATAYCSPDGAVFEQDMFAQEQFDKLVEMIKPIKSKVLGAVASNHEARFFKLGGLDVSKMMCDRLDIPYFGEAAFLNVSVGNNSYKIYALHGASNSVSPTGKMTSLYRFLSYIDADVFMMGHTHSKEFREVPYFTLSQSRSPLRDTGIYKRKRALVLTGSFLDYGGYAALRGLPPQTMGTVRISLFKNKWDVHVSL